MLGGAGVMVAALAALTLLTPGCAAPDEKPQRATVVASSSVAPDAPAAASATATGAVAELPQTTPPPEAVVGNPLFLDASAAFARGDYPIAVSLFQRVTAADGTDFQAWYWLARAHHESGAHGLARAAYARALAIDDDHPGARYGLALSFFDEGDWDSSEDAFEDYNRRFPDDADGLAQLALTQAQQDDLPAAEQNARRALSIRPASGVAHAVLGYVFEQRDDVDGAIREYRVALQGGVTGQLKTDVEQALAELS